MKTEKLQFSLEIGMERLREK